jgi:phenylalanyl-tRNA synthetase beta chain
MKFTLSWLHDYLSTDAPVAEIARVLTAIGLEVESITDPAETLGVFKVAEILEAVPHPDADRLRVCQVNDGEQTLQIVCGAPNARAGLKVALAPVGAIIPNGNFAIKASKIRGVESNGMLCSETELGLGKDSNGIMELPATLTPGQRFIDAMELNDPVIEIAITPNRGDCLGVYGIARDLAAAGVGRLKQLAIPSVKPEYKSPVSIILEDTEACPYFIGRHFSEVKNRPSPDWLQNRLKSIGLQPISALVDITNYIAYAFGRPLHVYDADTLGTKLKVRAAKAGEKINALDNKEYTLTEGLPVVADDDSVLAIGGVIGGVPSGCTEQTTNVFLEVAFFEPIAVAKAGRALQIDSDSRYRFERHVDPNFMEDAAALASQMILELCGGKPSDFVIAGKNPHKKRTIAFPLERVKTLGGVDLPERHILNILNDLGFIMEGRAPIRNVQVPSWRNDVEGSADLVEEVLRIHGYDNLEVVPLPFNNDNVQGPLSPEQRAVSSARRLLATRGLQEVVTWSFMSSKKAKLFAPVTEELTLLNPISSDLDVMRPSVIGNLLDAAARNAARGFANVAFFEIGPVFASATPEGRQLHIAGIRAGAAAPKNPHKTERGVDLFDVKADALAALEIAGAPVSSLQVVREAPEWYHPGRSGAFKLGKQVFGYFGEIHPLFMEAFDLKHTVVAFELMPEGIPVKRKKGTAKPKLMLSDYQSVTRDFAFVVEETVAAEELLRAIRGADKTLIETVSLFDVYQGKGVEDGKKSVALSVKLQPKDKTLTDEEIEAVSRQVIAAVGKQCGGVLRG